MVAAVVGDLEKGDGGSEIEKRFHRLPSGRVLYPSDTAIDASENFPFSRFRPWLLRRYRQQGLILRDETVDTFE